MLCLQEVCASTYELIKDVYGDQASGHYTPSWRFPFSKRSTGVLTIANSGLVDLSAQQLISPSREFGFVSPKVSLRSALSLSGDKKSRSLTVMGLILYRSGLLKNSSIRFLHRFTIPVSQRLFAGILMSGVRGV